MTLRPEVAVVAMDPDRLLGLLEQAAQSGQNGVIQQSRFQL